MPEASTSLHASDWIAIAAFLVSALALGVSIFEMLINQPRLRIRCKLALEYGGFSDGYCHFLNGFSPDTLGRFEAHKGRKFVCVTITNFGTQPTTIATVHFEFPSIEGIVQPQTDREWGVGPGVALGPGQIAMLYYDAGARLPPSDQNLAMLVAKGSGEVIANHSWSERPKRRRLR